MSVDVEIYMNNLVKFFKENPKDLLNLIPQEKEDEFYKKIREVALINYEKGDEISLTQKQFIDICRELHGQILSTPETIVPNNIIIQTKFGEICLN